MVTTVLLAIGLLVCQGQSQIFGLGCFPGPLGIDNGLYGPGPFVPLAQPIYTTAPPCVQQAPACSIPASCGIQVPPCSLSGPSCGLQVPPCSLSGPSCGIQVPTCGLSGPSCGIQVPPCGLSVSTCGIQVPPCGLSVPPCGIQVPTCGISVPPCAIQAPIINNIAPSLIPNLPCSQCSSFIPNQQCGQCSPFPQNLAPISPPCSTVCDYKPQINSAATGVIDNTLANSLANALQLLIFSNLLENTLSTPCSNSLGSFAPICETVSPYNYNVSPCNQIVTCEPYETFVSPYNSCFQEQIGYGSPCVEVSPCGQVFGTNFCPDCACDSCAYPYSNTFGCSDNCGLVNSYANTFGCSDNCGLGNSYANTFGCSDNCGLINSCGNTFGCSDNCGFNSYPSNFGCSNNCGLSNLSPFANNFGCLDSIFSPTVAEVLFPAEIPAQLTCNFGYMPTNVPCVSVNVEALPYNSCNCNKRVF